MKTNQKNLYKLLLGIMLREGKGSVAQKIVDTTYLRVFQKLRRSFSSITRSIFSSMGTKLEIRKVRRGRILHLVPFPVTKKRQKFLVIRNLISSVRDNGQKDSLSFKLAVEIITVLLGRSAKSKKTINSLIRTIRKSKANLHYRW
jgi:ribosomal protein S7